MGGPGHSRQGARAASPEERNEPVRVAESGGAFATPASTSHPAEDGLIGRDPEWQACTADLHDALVGRMRVDLIVGPPGIGKTCLAGEVARQGTESGALSLTGRGWESGLAPPLWPWIEVAHDYARHERGVSIPSCIPEVALPDSDGSAVMPRAEGNDRWAVFAAFRVFLERAAERRPIVLFLDDLHATDADSRALFLFLARAMRRVPLLLLATLRDVESRADDVFWAELCRLSRSSHVRWLSLAPWGPVEVARFLHRQGTLPTGELVERIGAASGGNPFFVGELARRLVGRAFGGDDGLALDPADLDLLRVGSLEADERRALEAAAVWGGRFDRAMLESVSGMSGPELREIISGSCEKGILREADLPGWYDFVQPLTRQELLRRMSLRARAQLHGRCAACLESRGRVAGPGGIRLVRHLLRASEAEQRRRGTEGARRAAADVIAMGLPERAVSLLQEAGRVAARDGNTNGASELVLALADVERRCGRTDRARSALRRLHDSLQWCTGSEVASLRRRAARTAALLPQTGGRRSLAGLLDAARQDAARNEDRRVIESALARARMADGDRPAAEVLLRAWTKADGSAVRHPEVALARHRWLDQPGDLQERLRLSVAIAETADRAGNAELARIARRVHLRDRLEEGDPQALGRAVAALRLSLREERDDAAAVDAHRFGAARFVMLGAFDEAVQFLARARHCAERAQSRTLVERVAAQELFFQLELGEFPLPGGARGAVGHLLNALASARQGRLTDARALLGQMRGMHDGRRSRSWLGRARLAAEACALTGDREEAARWLVDLEPYAQYDAVLPHAAVTCGPVSGVLAVLASACGVAAPTQRWLAAARDRCMRSGMEVCLARILESSARAALAAGAEDAPAVRDRLEEAASICDRFSMGGAQAALPVRGALPVPDTAPPPRTAGMRREGRLWALRFGPHSVRVPHRRGMDHLVELLRRPQTPVHVLELETADEASGGRRRAARAAYGRSAQDVVDATALRAYRQRYAELEGELDRAEANGDRAERERCHREREALLEQVRAATRRGGGRRAFADPDRLRSCVTRRIRRAIMAIREAHEELGRHLDNSIRTGAFCVYQPESPIDWET